MRTELVFNGIDATSGGYLRPPTSPDQLPINRAPEVDSLDHAAELRWRHRQFSEASLAPIEGIDPKDLASAGWAVVLPHGCDPAIAEALAPLVEHRRQQATVASERRFARLDYRPGESKQAFLARHRAGPGPADPDRVPYYLLLVGGPAEIPYTFQYQLDVQYAIGRIHFDDLEDYARYAESVVAAETRPPTAGSARAMFFGASNHGDPATSLSASQLVTPLAAHVGSVASAFDVETVIGDAATKQRLASALEDAPGLLFTATHGIGFPTGHARQRPDQGALLCQDWPGPDHRAPIDPAWYFAADDLDRASDLTGLISFHFACYSAGTPEWDDYSRTPDARDRLAPAPFVAALPQRLLANPGGGALAVVGHVERAWGYSFSWPDAGTQTAVYESCLSRLVDGHPVGSALEYFNERYAELSADLAVELEDVRYGKDPDELALASMWTANNDARAFALIGDPAVRLAPVAAEPLSAAAGPVRIAEPAPAEPAPQRLPLPVPVAVPADDERLAPVEVTINVKVFGQEARSAPADLLDAIASAFRSMGNGSRAEEEEART
jgi:Peptidase family C25